MRVFLQIVLFVVAGPCVGLLAMALLIGSYTLIMTGSPRDFVFGPDLVAPGILIMTYSVGGGPALLTGIAASVAVRWIAGLRYWLAVALAGGLLSLAMGFALIGMEPVGVNGPVPVAVMVALAGAAAGFACAALFDGLAALLRRDG